MKGILGLAFAVVLVGCTPPEKDMDGLASAIQNDEAGKAEKIAEDMSHSSKGVAEALTDLRVSGGRSNGYAEAILKRSPLTNEVVSGLKKIASDPAEGPERQIAANMVLWEKTGRDLYLLEIFKLSKNGGTFAASHGRGILRRNLVASDETKFLQEDDKVPWNMCKR